MRPRSPAGGRRVRRSVDAGARGADGDIITAWIWGIGTMAEVELYTTIFCPYCARARALLERKGVAYTDIDILEEPVRRSEMIRRAGGRTTVPQIFIDGEHIGGSDELVALDRAGELDAKLGMAK
jgi:glutaredoxin 3